MKFQCLFITVFIIVIFSISFANSLQEKTFLSSGSSLSVEDDSVVLVSPDQTFTWGFYGLGENAYWFAIWFTNSKQKTVIWTANRDKPVNGQGSRISLKKNGAMVLTDVDGSILWQTNTTSLDVSKAELLNTGNLVLKDFSGKILWQSFDFPTDTLVANQFFRKSTNLISGLRRGNFGSGYFNFFFDNNNVLTLMYDGPEISSIYWPNPDYNVFANGRTNYNSSRIAVFDEMGVFLSSDKLQFSASDIGLGVKRRLTLDYDGNLRLYSLDSATGFWRVTWEAISELCSVHGICGRNGICVYTPQPKCSCPVGYQVTDPSDWSQGCKPKFTQTCSQTKKVKFVQIPQVDFYGFDLNYTAANSSLNSCLKLCLDDCRCVAFSYRLSGEGVCYTKSALFNGYRSPNFPGSIYLKLPVSVESNESQIPFGSNPECGLKQSILRIGSPSMYENTAKRVKWSYLYWFAASTGVAEILLIVSIGWLLFGREEVSASLEEGYRALSSQFRKFTYAELKEATKNFKEELGRGASGVVYKGVLVDGRVVAVKKLGDNYQEEDVFWAEVSTIGKINHMNLVRMWGFCSAKNHRILVYEYMENKSLDKHLFAPNVLGWKEIAPNVLGWKERLKVALGTAKGLAYLHHECLEWVIHCDVKPENILLDNDFDPKISDFGLAKLLKRGNFDNSSEFSQIRGTKGYMAPEWALNLPITAKVDVYSYGVVILELVRGIRLSNFIAEDEEVQESELARFIRVVKRKMKCNEESWIEEMVDPRLNGEYNRKQIVEIVEIGLACLENDRNQRPTMDSVVQALVECVDELKLHTPEIESL